MNTEVRTELTPDEQVEEVFDELKITGDARLSVRTFLSILRQKSEQTFYHSIRVALLARKIARFMHLDEKALFFAGLLHDLGKSLVPLSTLHKTSGWSADDARIMESHVIDSYRLLRDKFDFKGGRYKGCKLNVPSRSVYLFSIRSYLATRTDTHFVSIGKFGLHPIQMHFREK